MARQKNPRPRIGRKDKELKFSKAFQKKNSKRKKKKDEIIKEEPRKGFPSDYPFSLPEGYIEGLIASGTLGSKFKGRKPELTDVIDRATILANEYGIDGAAELLQVDIDFLDYALRGNRLTSKQDALLEKGYVNLRLERDDIDLDELEAYARNLKQAIIWVNEEQYVGNEFKNTFRYGVANDQIPLKELSGEEKIEGYTLFAQGLDGNHRSKINDFIAGGGDTREMFEAYRKDIEEKGTIFFAFGDEEFNESYFWEWFRETFYP